MKYIVVPSVLTILGVAFLILGSQAVLQGQRSESWPSVDGEITKSIVKRETKRRDSTSGKKRSKTSYYPAIEYTYSVDGISHTGTRIAIMKRGYAFRSSAEAEVNKYPVGKSVRVFYDTSSPNDSMLIPGGNALLYVFPVLGSVFLIAAPIVFYVVCKKA